MTSPARTLRPYRQGVANINDALRRCVGQTVAAIEVTDDGKERRFIFADGSRFTFYTNGAFWWEGPELQHPTPALSQGKAERA